MIEPKIKVFAQFASRIMKAEPDEGQVTSADVEGYVKCSRDVAQLARSMTADVQATRQCIPMRSAAG